jgi:hypothetical protein
LPASGPTSAAGERNLPQQGKGIPAFPLPAAALPPLSSGLTAACGAQEFYRENDLSHKMCHKPEKASAFSAEAFFSSFDTCDDLSIPVIIFRYL